MMIDSIITGISREIGKEFGKKYIVYTEDVEQGMKEPCFFVACDNHTTNLFRGNKYFSQNLFCINYFPDNEKKVKQECNEVAERLALCLEYITSDGDEMRGTNMHHEVVDGVLSFFVNYDCFVYRVEEPEENMGTIKISQTLKG